MRSFDHGTWLLTSESGTLAIGHLLIGISPSSLAFAVRKSERGLNTGAAVAYAQQLMRLARDFSSSQPFVRGRQVRPSGEAMNSPLYCKNAN